MKRSRSRAFTIIEMLVAAGVFGMISVALLGFSQSAVRMVSRNFATNHSHDSVRISQLRLLEDLHDAASPYRLFTFNGTTYTDETPTATGNQEPLSQKFVSTRANGVRFRQLAGGPYKLTTNTTAVSTNLTFNFTVSAGQPFYVPQIGDKVVLPLIAREYAISAVPTVPSSGSPTGTVTINDSAGLGFTIDTTGGKITTGYFYREIAYSVFGGALRLHGNFTGANKGQFTVVRDKITSPTPFALLFPTSSASVENLALRVSLEAYDPDYSNRRFANGTVTLQTIIPPLENPTPVSATDAY